jgi:hypothetical protein
VVKKVFVGSAPLREYEARKQVGVVNARTLSFYSRVRLLPSRPSAMTTCPLEFGCICTWLSENTYLGSHCPCSSRSLQIRRSSNLKALAGRP